MIRNDYKGSYEMNAELSLNVNIFEAVELSICYPDEFNPNYNHLDVYSMDLTAEPKPAMQFKLHLGKNRFESMEVVKRFNGSCKILFANWICKLQKTKGVWFLSTPHETIEYAERDDALSDCFDLAQVMK